MKGIRDPTGKSGQREIEGAIGFESLLKGEENKEKKGGSREKEPTVSR